MNLGDVTYFDLGDDRGPLVVRVISEPRLEDPEVTRMVDRAMGYKPALGEDRRIMVVDVETAYFAFDGAYWATNDVRSPRVFDLRESAQRLGPVPEKFIPRRTGRVSTWTY